MLMPADKVDIEGLYKPDVLLTLYNRAVPEGTASAFQAMIFREAPRVTQEAVSNAIRLSLLDNGFYFDSVDLGSGSRLLEVDIYGCGFDATAYNARYGKNAAQNAISALREIATAAYIKRAERGDALALFILEEKGPAPVAGPAI
jgi:hypothetical protein